MTAPINHPVSVGADVGGTKVMLGTLGADGTLRNVVTRDTQNSQPEGIAEQIAAYVRTVPYRVPVGVSAAGLVNANGEVLVGSYIAWDGFPLASFLAGALHAGVRVTNDGTASAWGEYIARGRPPGPLLFVTIGTGLGGGLVADGRPYEGAHGLATEVGHLVVDPSGPSCRCGNRGCLEAIAGGSGIAEAFALTRPGTPTDGARGVVVAARQGDPVAGRCLEAAGGWLGTGLAQLCSILDPALIVIGGGVGLSSELLVAAAKARFAGSLRFQGRGTDVTIERSVLGPQAALYGAAHLAQGIG